MILHLWSSMISDYEFSGLKESKPITLNGTFEIGRPFANIVTLKKYLNKIYHNLFGNTNLCSPLSKGMADTPIMESP